MHPACHAEPVHYHHGPRHGQRKGYGDRDYDGRPYPAFLSKHLAKDCAARDAEHSGTDDRDGRADRHTACHTKRDAERPTAENTTHGPRESAHRAERRAARYAEESPHP